ncbi:MAG TPA: VOC family protein [Candidatus Melainabacteria bacterium]|jgi:PhnB protein|nr:VOC family protein [Candidatus Melainabacteria bacterium]
MPKLEIEPYLFFGGKCEEALAFYSDVLGAETLFKMRFSESPDPLPEGMIADGFEDKIMHSTFRVKDTTIMASDGCGPEARFEGFSLAINLDDEAEAKRIFEGLSKGGKVDMPLSKTFWSPCYGMLTDRFGVAWMVMVQGSN